jgi:general secretion pathway protein I
MGSKGFALSGVQGRSPWPYRTAEHGFTLLEVLVAFIIATVALVALYSAGTGGLRSIEAAAHYQQAISRARSHLAMAAHGGPLTAGEWQGDDGSGFAWRLRVTPIASTTVQSVNVVNLGGSLDTKRTLYAVSVWIIWRDADAMREVRLDTNQIGQVAR